MTVVFIHINTDTHTHTYPNTGPTNIRKVFRKNAEKEPQKWLLYSYIYKYRHTHTHTHTHVSPTFEKFSAKNAKKDPQKDCCIHTYKYTVFIHINTQTHIYIHTYRSRQHLTSCPQKTRKKSPKKTVEGGMMTLTHPLIVDKYVCMYVCTYVCRLRKMEWWP